MVSAIRRLKLRAITLGVCPNGLVVLLCNTIVVSSQSVTCCDVCFLVDAEESAGLQEVMQHSLHLFSAAGYAPFSNYTPTFQHLLDYILVSEEDFTVQRVAHCPGHEVLGEFTALPSPVIPSDHISIAVDLCFKD
jgi:hypothetical protein